MPNNPIAISSGHGKYVRGAMPPYMDEVDEARRVVAQVATELKVLGCTVRGPFNDDISKSKNENLNRIVDWHNAQSRALDVSVHFNANVATSNPMGTECLYVTQNTLAGQVASAIADAGKLKNRGGKKRTDLFFLNNTAKPAILIEVCFVDSTADRDLYNANFAAICAAIAQTISGMAASGPSPEPPQPTPEPPIDRPTIGEGDEGPAVESVQRSLGLPVDGDFGPKTDADVHAFQTACKIGSDGIVGPQTWRELDELDRKMAAGNDGISDELAHKIDVLAQDSPLQSYSWPDRGRAPPGLYAGMGKVYALAVMRLRDDDEAADIMAHAETADPDKDALTWYRQEFAAQGMHNNTNGQDTLRHLFVMMVGLAMRESAGDHWCGIDASAGASSESSDTCEAGLLQTSWNIRSCSSAIAPLLTEYWNDPNGLRPTFTRGLSPHADDLKSYGSGDGARYQWLAKFSPAFAALVTGVGMRRLRQHWGPINRKEVRIEPKVEDFLLGVDDLIESQEVVA